MKVALIILHADPARGGAERYTIDLAAALERRGEAVSLVSCASEDVGGDRAPQGPPWRGVQQVRLEARARGRARQYQRFLDSLDEHLAEHDYDIVHAMLPVRRCDVYHPHAGIAVEMARPLDRLLRPRRRAMAGVERELLGGSDPPVVLALSEYVKQTIRRHYPLPAEKLATLFNAVDLERFEPVEPPARHRGEPPPQPSPGVPGEGDRPGEGVMGLMIANDFERKGLTEAIEAMGRLRNEPLRLVVAGRQDPLSYRRQAGQIGAAVEFVGPVTDPRPLYRRADFFLLPTRHDPCSLVVLEALAMGLPVISTRYNGACEIMTDGEHGFILEDPSDIDALVTAIRKMLDPDRRREMTRACLDLRPRLSYEHHLDELLCIYARAAGGR